MFKREKRMLNKTILKRLLNVKHTAIDDSVKLLGSFLLTILGRYLPA